MQQEEIEYFAFLYLCGEEDRKILTKERPMVWEDFERFTYLTYHLGLMSLHMKLWTDYASKFQNKSPYAGDVNMLQESTEEKAEYEFCRREQWIREFCENAPEGIKEWLEDLDIRIIMNK